MPAQTVSFSNDTPASVNVEVTSESGPSSRIEVHSGTTAEVKLNPSVPNQTIEIDFLGRNVFVTSADVPKPAGSWSVERLHVLLMASGKSIVATGRWMKNDESRPFIAIRTLESLSVTISRLIEEP